MKYTKKNKQINFSKTYDLTYLVIDKTELFGRQVLRIRQRYHGVKKQEEMYVENVANPN